MNEDMVLDQVGHDRELETENAHLRAALEFALEMQDAEDAALPPGYGSSKNVIAWTEQARAALAGKGD